MFQGCGKSLAAKAVAADWQLPLLRLEPGRIYDKFIGESEKRLEHALDAAAHMAPCVLWIDEIEKGLNATGDSAADGGLSRRIMGRVLGWLQDRNAPVFVVATSNDVRALPPELLRKGRFDEVFFVDLPTADERASIFAIQLRSRGRDPGQFDLHALSAATEGFSGAEIEQAIASALYTAFGEGRELDTDDLLAETHATKPLSTLRAESIAALRLWAETRTTPASTAARESRA